MSIHEYLSFMGPLYECPHGKRLPDCPVLHMEDKSFNEKFTWFENLPDDEKKSLVEHHNQCSERRSTLNK